MKYYLYSFIISFFLSLVTTPLIIKFSRKHSLFDKPGRRKIHDKPISRIGGIGLFLAFVIAFFILFHKIKISINFKIYYYFIALCLSFILGLSDDIFYIRARYKLLAQIVIAFIATLSGLLINQFTFFQLFSINFGFFSYILTMGWIIVFMNAINLIDGMDGLASGVVAIASIFIFIISFLMGNWLFYI